MPTYTYGLYPFAWTAIGSSGYHAPPAGSACVLDLRNESQQATQGQSSGYGLFAWSTAPPNDLISLGTGYAPTLQIDSAARSELQTRLGLSGPPSGATLADAMASVLGELADPNGVSGPRPIMPGRDGTLELHLAGHSRIWSQRVDGDEVLSMSPKGRANRIRDVIRAKLTAAESIGGKQLMQKVLAAELLKLGLTREEVADGAPGKAAQWRRLLSTSLRAKHGDARPERPTTSFSESWPNATASGLGSTAQDQTWAVQTFGSAWAGTMGVGGGLAYRASNGGETFSWGAARCASVVSSSDHTVTLDFRCPGGTPQAQATVRHSDAAATAYGAWFFRNSSRRLGKWVSGTLTVLSSVSTAFSGTQIDIGCDIDGSTLSGTFAGFGALVATDTSIASGFAGGLLLGPISGSDEKAGAWSIDDGLGGGGGGGAFSASGSAIIKLSSPVNRGSIPTINSSR